MAASALPGFQAVSCLLLCYRQVNSTSLTKQNLLVFIRSTCWLYTTPDGKKTPSKAKIGLPCVAASDLHLPESTEKPHCHQGSWAALPANTSPVFHQIPLSDERVCNCLCAFELAHQPHGVTLETSFHIVHSVYSKVLSLALCPTVLSSSVSSSLTQ